MVVDAIYDNQKKGEDEWLKDYHHRMRPPKLAHIPFSCLSSLPVLGRSSFRVREQFDAYLPFKGDQRDGR
jgi:hypothetical protein